MIGGMWRGVLVSTLLIAFLVVQPWPSDAAAPTASAFAQALAFAPKNAIGEEFTDWTLIKSYKGASALTSASPSNIRLKFLDSFLKDQAVASGFGFTYYFNMAPTWSFDSLDLQWEATVDLKGYTANVLRFRDGFDFSPVLKHFTQRQYSRTTNHGVVVYAHGQDISQGWFNAVPFILQHVAYLPDQHILVASTFPEGVTAALDAYRGAVPSLAGDSAIRATVAALGTVASALLRPESGSCAAFQPLPSTSSKGTPNNLSALRKQVHRYESFGIGYRIEGTHPLGVASLHFAAPASAAADLPLRRSLAATGISPRAGAPYSKTVFILESTAVTGADLVFRLRPVHDHPSLLFTMVFNRDVLFALCP